jgi:tetratricopeptide (TPR) repeat protein
MVYDWDWAGAEREFQRAVALRPGEANAHLWLGRLQVLKGRSDDGLANTRRALNIDPLSLIISARLGWDLYYAGRDDEALKHLRNANAANPGSNFFDFVIGLVLEHQGDHAGAIAAFEKSVAADSNNDALAQLAHGFGTAGRRRDAERMIARLMENRKKSFAPAGALAYAYAGLGERDEAFHWLDLALEDHSEILTVLKVDPGFDPLRSDPRFAVVLRRIGLQD